MNRQNRHISSDRLRSDAHPASLQEAGLRFGAQVLTKLHYFARARIGKKEFSDKLQLTYIR